MSKHSKRQDAAARANSDPALVARLKAAGLRPTRQRLALAQSLFGSCDRHVTAEQLHGEARAAGAHISLATVYNTLHQFTAAGLLREVLVEPGRVYFDTNTGAHHHFYHEDSGDIVDIAANEVAFARLPTTPDGRVISAVDVVIRVRPNRTGAAGG
ncbi:MAG: Fur family transcriptional regulator [Alphaproteobacteria bacterium]